MAKLGGIYVDVIARTDKYKRDLAGAKTTAQKASVAIQKQFDKINFKNALIGLTAFTAAATVAITKSIQLANEQEAVEKRLEAVIRATGQAAGFNTEQLKEMASAMQEVTTVGDEVILKGMAVLATFKQIRGEGFERATQAALDMSEVMQQDLGSAIVMIGKALNDPIANLSAMSRAGVQFTKVQKDMVKELWNAGRAAEAQAIILDELESQFGGAAKAARDTFGGAMKAASNAFGDMQENIGFVITKNKVLIDLVKEAEQAFIDAGEAIGAWASANDKLIAQRTHEAIDKIKSTVSGLLDIYNSLPEGIIGSAGFGLIGKILFGSSIGKIVFTISLINDGLSQMNMGLGDLVEKHKATGDAVINLWNSIKDAMGLANDELERSAGLTLFKIPARAGGDGGGDGGGGGGSQPVDLKTLQAANRKKYAMDIALAEQIGKDTWQIRQEGYENALKQQEEAQTQQTQAVYDIWASFNEQYNELGKTRFDIEREQIEQQMQIYREAGIEENRIAKMTSDRNREISRAEQKAKLDIYQNIAGGVAETFRQISQAGGKQSKEAFIVYKAFAVAQAAILGVQSVLQALASAPPPYSFVLAGIAGAAAAVQIGMISSSQPPSYDVGGVSSARGVYQTGNIREAHVPIPSGKIPVQINGGQNQEPPQVNIYQTVDPSVMNEWAATPAFANGVFNVLGSQSQRLRNVQRGG